MNKKIVVISWEQIKMLLRDLDFVGNKIYGVPNGGLMVCALLTKATVVTNPKEANIILDDVCDSGKTRLYYNEMYPNISFVTLFMRISQNEFQDNNNFTYEGSWLVFPWEKDHIQNAKIEGVNTCEDNVTRLLQYIGEDVSREGLIDTSRRVIKSFERLYSGYNQNVEDILTTFDSESYNQIILLDNIEMYSMCEHHMLPFFGRAHVAYIPNGKEIVGISKLARIVDIFSRRLQNQERIGEQVTAAIMEHMAPLGAACIIEAQHLCMKMRGVEKQNSVMKTSSLKGVFLEKAEARQELFNLLSLRKG